MELELLPVIFGGVAVLCGAALVADGWIPDSAPRVAERRRRARAERDRVGEVAIGAGIVALGAALIGRDAWRFGTVAVLVGVALVLVGALRNVRYLRERLVNRGAARRGRSAERRHEGAPERPTLVDGDHDRRGNDRRGDGERAAADPRGPSAMRSGPGATDRALGADGAPPRRDALR